MTAVAVDVRTRIDGPRPDFDPDQFFADDLPAGLDEHADGIVRALPFVRPRPVTVPNSCPRSLMNSPTLSLSSVGNGPAPTRVV